MAKSTSSNFPSFLRYIFSKFVGESLWFSSRGRGWGFSKFSQSVRFLKMPTPTFDIIHHVVFPFVKPFFKKIIDLGYCESIFIGHPFVWIPILYYSLRFESILFCFFRNREEKKIDFSYVWPYFGPKLIQKYIYFESHFFLNFALFLIFYLENNFCVKRKSEKRKCKDY